MADRIYIPIKQHFSHSETEFLDVIRRLIRNEPVYEKEEAELKHYFSIGVEKPRGINPRTYNPAVLPVVTLGFKQITMRKAKTNLSSIALYTKIYQKINSYQPRYADIDEANPYEYYYWAYVNIPNQDFKPLMRYSSAEYYRIKRKSEDVAKAFRNSVAFFFDLLIREPKTYDQITGLAKELYT